MAIKSHHDIEAYQRAKKLLVPVHQLIPRLPVSERLGLGDQMRRASKSVVDNIVEGYSPKETPVKPLIEEYTIIAKQLFKLIQNWRKF